MPPSNVASTTPGTRTSSPNDATEVITRSPA
eukprot:CAMPEP_0176084738 /NCGR_PEP_ID=MMETSP0120_2-20121206/42405_1 /TAXON_ID=160619 /ORGANISM="Kryptoperidinium foliaceum, Strain CCMP 1326" /LENGTH=30 /DNA_ID= /DNA_START= /DNA_END= /DNA_ORIENTATION=